MKALVLYDSLGGNTEKVAKRIHDTLQARGVDSVLVKVREDTDLDLYAFDLLFLGAPVIAWGPTDTMRAFVMKKLRAYHKGKIQPSAPIRPGKFGVSFCTFSGTHIGEPEAVPLTKWFSAFLGHLGCQVLGEWHMVGAFHKESDANVKGRLGDIRGRPNEQDLVDTENRVKGLVAGLAAWIA